MSKELKPCPFCAGKIGVAASYVGKEQKKMWHLDYCCGMTGWSKLYETEKECIEAWNTRPSPWKKINSEADLPKELGQFLVYATMGKDWMIVDATFSFEFNRFIYTGCQDGWIVTRYQLIDLPKD